jgi:hypothetical protein
MAQMDILRTILGQAVKVACRARFHGSMPGNPLLTEGMTGQETMSHRSWFLGISVGPGLARHNAEIG